MNEIIMAAAASGIGAMLVTGGIAEMIRAKGKKIKNAEAAAWKELCRIAMEERDLLLRRVESRDCQKVLYMQEKLDEAMTEIDRLTVLSDTYKKELDRKRKAPASSDKAGQAQSEG